MLFFVRTAFVVVTISFVCTYSAVNAARSLHDLMLDRVFSSPAAFFDVTPLGRILNRFRYTLVIHHHQHNDEVNF